jgi:hypothetical protein
MSKITALNTAAFVAAASLISLPEARAELILPALSVSGFASINNGGPGDNGLTSTITNTTSVPTGAIVENGANSAGASVTAGFAPLLQVEAITGNQNRLDDGSPTGHAEAQLTYYFSLTGPDNGQIQGFATGTYSLTAPVFPPNPEASFPKVFGSFSYSLECVSGSCNPLNQYPDVRSSTADSGKINGQPQPYITAFQLDPNSVYEVDLAVSIDVQGKNQSGLATIDPIFSTDATGYTFTFSPELFAASAPEPSTWAMMLMGFAGLGFMAYRRRNTLRIA